MTTVKFTVTKWWRSKCINKFQAQFDTQLEYDYYGESDLDTGHTDDVEGASVPEDSVDMSQVVISFLSVSYSWNT
jgi:hypothetical protein